MITWVNHIGSKLKNGEKFQEGKGALQQIEGHSEIKKGDIVMLWNDSRHNSLDSGYEELNEIVEWKGPNVKLSTQKIPFPPMSGTYSAILQEVGWQNKYQT